MATQNLSWCTRIETRINSWVPQMEIRPGTISEIATSAALSFTINMVFNRCNLGISCKGAGIAVLAKLVQVTVTLAQQRLTKPAETPPGEQAGAEGTSDQTPEEPQTGIKYSLIYYSTKSATFVGYYLKKMIPASVAEKLTQSPIETSHIYMLVAMGVFSYSSVQPWASLLSCWIYGKMTIDPNVGFFFEQLPYCVVLKA